MIDEAELKHRILETDKTFQTDGWEYVEAEWYAEREKIISLGKKAIEGGQVERAAYFFANLSGFDRALNVPRVFKQRYKEFMTTPKDDKEIENA